MDCALRWRNISDGRANRQNTIDCAPHTDRQRRIIYAPAPANTDRNDRTATILTRRKASTVDCSTERKNGIIDYRRR